MDKHSGIFVIFGITGDLAKRKLLPALYRLAAANLLDDDFKILGTTRRNTTVEDIIQNIHDAVQSVNETVDSTVIDQIRHQLTLVHMDIDNPDEYGRLQSAIDHAERSIGKPANKLYYLAVPPNMFGTIVDGLGAQGLQKCDAFSQSRLLIEKPFGYEAKSAQALADHLHSVFNEAHIYRVDHYLAKETAQNILRFRFDNPLIQAAWDNADLDHIMISASETIGIEGRVNFYESTGALRDLIQSHLLQLLALVTMEQPADNSPEALHEAKLNLLKSIKPIRPDQVGTYSARGQYDSYTEEVSNPDSLTETCAAIRLDIDNERWRDVPVLLRAGKAMANKVTEISLVYKRHDETDHTNVLTIRIQPNEGIILHLIAKKPSLHNETELVEMDFFYKDYFKTRQPDAYERVLIDAIRGDKTLFTTDEEVLVCWQIIDAVLEAWTATDEGMETYQSGSWGPQSIKKLAESVDATWMTEALHAHTD
jgi:glucose-6-phosphate 1-dehydrogenase